jgi:hypothetical protein
MDNWLERLDRFLTIIRPQAYNVIARATVGLGLVLVAESQLNIAQFTVIAVYENLFGYSEFLREHLVGGASPWMGLFLIVVGLAYHYLITAGKEQVELRLSEIPKKPELTLEILNADLEEYQDNNINLRGFVVLAPPEEEIPKYRISYDYPNMEGLSNVLNTFGNMEKNPTFYQERGEFLKIWGGSELILLKIMNTTEVIATGVKVEVRIPRIKGVSADNTKEAFPSTPNDKATNHFGSISISSLTLPRQTIHYDVKSEHSEKEYRFFWNVSEVQANTSCTSDTYIFLRSEESVDIDIKIYCDQFPSPVLEKYSVNRKGQPRHVSVSDLMT